jgi:type II restriction/modification system DNA methylase subunit YeeA
LKQVKNIQHMDAILGYETLRDLTPPSQTEKESSESLRVYEPEWPAVDVIIGNPPFLGGKRMRSELGDEYVNNLFELYEGRVPREADLVAYWFEKARSMIERKESQRVGLLGTQGIRGGANQKVLQKIATTGRIFWAQSDRDWILDGATVHVSMVGFDSGNEKELVLDGNPVLTINADLTSDIDLTKAKPLHENFKISFMGVTPAGPFDLDGQLARQWLLDRNNPNGRPNSEVLKPYYNGTDLTRKVRDVWIVDFGVDMPLDKAAAFEKPFEYLKKFVFPIRQRNNRVAYREKWWLLAESRPAMRDALALKDRYIGTSMVSKHHIFCWIDKNVLPANLIIVIARDDDYFLGVIHSSIHEVWARRKGTQLREASSGYRYTPSSTFETFPFPWSPGQEPIDDPRLQAIAHAAKELMEQRDRWLNPQVTVTSEVTVTSAERKKRTLTNLYNARPTWLDLAHRRLDEAVFAAYGWQSDLSDEEILAKLLALNLERSK